MTRYAPKHAADKYSADKHSADNALRAQAVKVQSALCEQDNAWGTGGWTRRRFIAGAGMVGAATMASQLVTTRAAFGDTSTAPTENTLVVIFMRGAADGLRILIPNSPDLGLTYLREVRPSLLPANGNLLPLPGATGWALNSALKPLYDGLWGSGELAFVPGVSTPAIPRSHFQAQQLIEKGGSASATSGWLDRVLTGLGPGTTFRAVAEGSAQPLSLAGTEQSLALSSINNFTLSVDKNMLQAKEDALATLYRGLDGPLGEDVPDTIAALATADQIRATTKVQNGAVYPNTPMSTSLKDLAAMLRAEVGLQVATVDVGGWDTHTDEVNDLDSNLASFASSLNAFMTDLGPDRRKRVTVVVQTEFGRRVAANGSGGSDHGHGSVMWLLGGGLAASAVQGAWTPLSASVLDNGDVPGFNSPFDVLGELVQTRLGVGSLSTIFPNQSVKALGLAKRS